MGLALAIRGRVQELRVNEGPANGPWRTAMTFDVVRDPVRVLALSENGRQAWLAARLGADTRGVFEMDLRAGRVVRRVGYDPEFDFDGTAVVVGNELRALNWNRDVAHTQWLDMPVESAASDQWIPVSLRQGGRRGLFRERTDRGWGAYRWWDSQTGQSLVLQLDGEGSASERVTLGRPMEPLTWHARDGERVHGYLIRPASRPGPRPPLMVLVHGGPWDRDRWGWHPEAQFLAQRGWAVLMVNYRGSTGYGWRFQQLGAGQWARAADDLIDGARWVASQGWADGRRVGVAGASFGGFLAVLASSRPDTPFVAAASVGGAFDLERWLRETRRREVAFVADTQRAWLLGSERPDPDSLRIPVRSVRRPVLLLHAEDDGTVEIAQSVELAAALRAVGTAVEWVRLNSGGHSMGTADQQEAVWTRVAAFLEAVSSAAP
jgi:acetyl esterase/lipase